MLRKGYYLKRPDDDMVCRIIKVELTTDAEQGNYLIVTGLDAKSLLDQRIVWETTTAQGNAETFVRKLVSDSVIAPLVSDRMCEKPGGGLLVQLDTAAGLTASTTEQVSYKNVGAKIRDVCQRCGWGYYFHLSGTQFAFGVQEGKDLSATVKFSPDFDNLISTDYEVDATPSKMLNAALVGGSGEGALRICEPVGTATSTDRYEVFVDAKNTSNQITYGELTEAYPLVADGGYGSIVPRATGYAYNMAQFDAQYYDNAQLLRLQNKYPGGMAMCSIYGDCYYRVTNVDIATFDSMTPADDDAVTLTYIAYSPRLCNNGYAALVGYGEKTSFTGEIEPSITFQYKTDYDLGDVVTVENEFGISATARIVEVMESMDETGYRVQPKFEYEG